MKKELRDKILSIVGEEVNYKGFILADSSSNWMIFHKKYDSETYDKLCVLMIKRLKKAYCWLERKRLSI